MEAPNLDGIGTALITIGVVITLIIWGITSLFTSNTDIVFNDKITPELKITVKNNIVDTLYVYKKNK